MLGHSITVEFKEALACFLVQALACTHEHWWSVPFSADDVLPSSHSSEILVAPIECEKTC